MIDLSAFAACGISASQLVCPSHHGSVVPVESGGEVVAYLCTDCDTQLPAEWVRGDVDHDHREVTEVATYMPGPVTRVECRKEAP